MKIIETHDMTIRDAAKYARTHGLRMSYSYLLQVLSNANTSNKVFTLPRQHAFTDPLRYIKFSRDRKKSGCKVELYEAF